LLILFEGRIVDGELIGRSSWFGWRYARIKTFRLFFDVCRSAVTLIDLDLTAVKWRKAKGAIATVVMICPHEKFPATALLLLMKKVISKHSRKTLMEEAHLVPILILVCF